MIDKLCTKFVLWYFHKLYLKYEQPILYIRGIGEDYPKYILYTENENVYKRMDEF